jgi:predicted metal-dependent HD superfamily phosphohydrolase
LGKQLLMELQETFTGLLRRIGFADDSIPGHWLDLKKAYSKKSRYYHNLTHLEEMIGCFEAYRGELQFPDEVLYALFYHDIVYKSTRKDNELKSAELAARLLPDDATISRQVVFDMILATKDHVCKGVQDEKWLIDFDLRILAKDWEGYEAYYKQIRKEYSLYPDFLYNPGRKKALEHFLNKECIYQTETFRGLYEGKARENIGREIRELEGGS